ncbi:MAG: type VI secretion system protein TssA [Proteobacteria bacterium]|nr:type VI secretion system protein TssA [Pseudomonadota bacterium]
MSAALALDIDRLLLPLDAAAPCGPDLSYDAAFMAAEQTALGKPERQYGDTVIAAEPPDWRSLHDEAQALCERTRDLRAGVWLLRSATRLHGLAGAEAGLRLLDGWLTQWWDTLHPELDASDDNDPTMRLNALAALVAGDGLAVDLDGAALSNTRGSLTVREWELALGKANARDGEAVPNLAAVQQALAALCAADAGLVARARAAAAHAEHIDQWLTDRLPGQGPELAPLRRRLRALAQAVQAAAGVPEEAAAPGEAATDAGDAPAAGVRSGGIANRADAAREIERVCVWLETHEPSNPAPLLLRRALRLMDLGFIDLLRDLAPDGLTQLRVIAGEPTA